MDIPRTLSETDAASNEPTRKRYSEGDSDNGGAVAEEVDGVSEEAPVGITERRKRRCLTKRGFSLPSNASSSVNGPQAVDAIGVSGEISTIHELTEDTVPRPPSAESIPTLNGNQQFLDVEVISLDGPDDATPNTPLDVPATGDGTDREIHRSSLFDIFIQELKNVREQTESVAKRLGNPYVTLYRLHCREMNDKSIATSVLRPRDLFQDHSNESLDDTELQTLRTNAKDRRTEAEEAREALNECKRSLNTARKQLLGVQSAVKKATAAVEEAGMLSAAAGNRFKESERALIEYLLE